MHNMIDYLEEMYDAPGALTFSDNGRNPADWNYMKCDRMVKRMYKRFLHKV